MTTAMATDMAFRQLRAPRQNGTALVQPPWEAAACQLAENRATWCSHTTHILGEPLAEFAERARQRLIQAALAYTAPYRPVPSLVADGRCKLILSGHQPQLFHPGVWFKNFALHRLAQDHDAIGMHLLIDNDQMGTPAISVPAGSLAEPHTQAVAYDDNGPAVPLEERDLINLDKFKGFAQAVRETLEPFVAQPLIEELWPHAVAAAERATDLGQTANLGQCLSQARHRLEAEWGLETLELPLSQICDSTEFLQFLAHVCVNAEEFQSIYNRAVLDYRSRNGVRSQSHPVPLLSRQEQWYEMPFWIWSAEAPVRLPLFVRQGPGGLSIRGGQAGNVWQLPLDVHTEPAGLEALRSWLTERGLKLRPRALMTTMYARVCLSDLFLHGLGGAKYDEVTDNIIESFVGIRPPSYMCLTATLQLPVPRPYVEQDDVRQVSGLLRDLWCHPERAEVPMTASTAGEFKELVHDKQRLIASMPPRKHRRAWHQQLTSLNDQSAGVCGGNPPDPAGGTPAAAATTQIRQDPRFPRILVLPVSGRADSRNVDGIDATSKVRRRATYQPNQLIPRISTWLDNLVERVGRRISFTGSTGKLNVRGSTSLRPQTQPVLVEFVIVFAQSYPDVTGGNGLFCGFV